MKNISAYMKLSLEVRQQHLNLNESCIYRGGYSYQFRGLLAHYLDTTIPNGHQAHAAHACHDSECCNPNHLYWATASENCKDKFSSPQGKEHRKILSEKMLGDKNINHNKKPWLVTNAKIHGWAKAGDIYNQTVMNGWDFNKHGQGPSYLINEFDLAMGTARAMVRMFKSGWNPHTDGDWKNRFTV
jgi:hypothetical protein